MISAPYNFDEFTKSLFICDKDNNIMINSAFIESSKEPYSSWNAYTSPHISYYYESIDGIKKDYNDKISGRYITMNHMSSNLHIMGYKSITGMSGTSFVPFDMHFIFEIRMLKEYFLSNRKVTDYIKTSDINRFDLLDIE